jgi:hypothetical protein
MLDETIWAGYASWKWIINASLSINGGVRYEHTHTLLRSDDGQELVNRSSGELFPSLYVIYSINPKNRIQLTYNKRITRPSFNDMAPFVFFIGPGTFVAGNLNLKPAIVQNIDLSYHFGHLWFSLRYSHSDNEIAMFQPEIDPQTNEQIFRTRNMEYLKTFGINTLFPVRITSWWKMQNDFSIYFYSGKTKQSGNTILQKKESMAFNIINTLSLPMNLTAELSASYQSGSFMGISHYRLSGPQVVAGIKKVLKNNASLSIIANDIFNGSKWNLTTRSDELDFISRWSYDWGGRSIILSYSHSFGNKNLKEVKINSRSIEEQGRVR